MPPQRLPGPQNFPPPTEQGGAVPQHGGYRSANPRPQHLEQPPPTGVDEPESTGEPADQASRTPTPYQSPREQRQGSAPGDSQQQGTDAEEAREQLQEAIEQSNEILITKQTALPMLADVLTVDRAKITVARRTFIRTAEVMSIRVEDLLNVTSQLGLIFGFVHITNRVAGGDKPTSVGPFWRSDALAIKRITQGYVIALQRSIDVSQLSCEELKTMLMRLGEDDHPGQVTNEPAD